MVPCRDTGLKDEVVEVESREGVCSMVATDIIVGSSYREPLFLSEGNEQPSRFWFGRMGLLVDYTMLPTTG